jgi:aldose 1-epimerase
MMKIICSNVLGKCGIFVTLVGLSMSMLSCIKSEPIVRVTGEKFGDLDDGREIQLYTLRNSSGASIQVMDLGATIVSLNVPDRVGKLDDITLGFDEPQKYLTDSPYFGAIVGRFANRIKRGQFSLDGIGYTLAINNGQNALHGGTVGFDKRLWKVASSSGIDHAILVFNLTSQDGDEGYPGTLNVEVTYKFDDENRLTVSYIASTDKATVINLSQHAYFNLNGHASGSVADHLLQLNASNYTPVDDTLIPTGDIASVRETAMDFRTEKPIGRDVGADFEQLMFGQGYDHNWVLDRVGEERLQLAASVYAPKSGRTMSVFTDQPGIQFYAGNFLDGSITGKGNTIYQHRNGFVLETQHFPDSPNHPNFPSTVLRMGDTYESKTVFQFGIK